MKKFLIVLIGILIIGGLTFSTNIFAIDTGTSSANLPGSLGLFWQTIKENISLLFTFDPETKAEKQLLFAEQRLNLAEKFAAQTTNPQLQNRAQQMITRSNDFLDKINSKASTLTQLSLEKQERLSERLQNHQQLRENTFDRLENQVEQETGDVIRKLRVQSLEKSQRLINALNNENLSEETRLKLEQIQTRIQTHLQEVQEYNQTRMQIREQIQAGEPQALQQMEALQTQRRIQIQNRLHTEIDEEELTPDETAQPQNNNQEQKRQGWNN